MTQYWTFKQLPQEPSFTFSVSYFSDDGPCVYGLKEDENVIFDNIFTEIPPPDFPGMKDSYCTNYCIRSGLCNAIFLAYNDDANGNTQFT